MNKTEIKKLKKTILKKDIVAFDTLTKSQVKAVFNFSTGYKTFLDRSKTEREAVKQIIEAARKKGFTDIEDALDTGKKQRGKFYKNFQNRCIALAVTGSEPVTSGTRIVASHIDSPRLDLKQIE